MDALVDTAWLAGRISAAGLRIVDVRWYLDPARKGREAYRAGHLPGAVFLDVDRDLSAPGGGRGLPAGRHPWPSEAQVGRVMGAAGIGPGVTVVAYDDQSGAVAARLWYLLRAHGHDDVAVLDGGIAKWQAEGRPLETTEPKVEPRVFTPRPRPGCVLSKEEMVGSHRGRLVLDARAPERYRGDAEPIDPRPGHVPGAKSAPFTGAGRLLRLRRDRLPRPAGPAPRRPPRPALRGLVERVEQRPLASRRDRRRLTVSCGAPGKARSGKRRRARVWGGPS